MRAPAFRVALRNSPDARPVIARPTALQGIEPARRSCCSFCSSGTGKLAYYRDKEFASLLDPG